jgi:hypothetical protein
MNRAPWCAGDDEEEELTSLRWHWDTAYDINLSAGTWTARFLPGTDTLTADSAAELRNLIRADYLSRHARQVFEDAHPATAGRDVGAGERALRRLRDEGVI